MAVAKEGKRSREVVPRRNQPLDTMNFARFQLAAPEQNTPSHSVQTEKRKGGTEKQKLRVFLTCTTDDGEQASLLVINPESILRGQLMSISTWHAQEVEVREHVARERPTW